MDYNSFVDDVVMDCPSLPIPLALRSIREAFRLFCKASSAYRYKLSATDLSYNAATQLYTIAVPSGFQVDSVISPMIFNGSYTVYTFSNGSQSTSPTPPSGTVLVQTDNYAIWQKSVQGASPEWLDINVKGWRTDISNDLVNYFAMMSSNSFRLSPDNGVDRSSFLTVSLVIFPDRSSLPSLDSEFCTRWFDHITAGAKFLLMAQANMEWSNPTLAQFYKAKFDDGIDEAKNYSKSGLRHAKADGINHVRLYY